MLPNTESIRLLLLQASCRLGLLRVIGSMMAIVFRPCDAALILSINSFGSESRMLREEMIRVDEEPSRLGDNCAKILTWLLLLVPNPVEDTELAVVVVPKSLFTWWNSAA